MWTLLYGMEIQSHQARGTFFTLCAILRFVVASAAEAELGALFLNCKQATIFWLTSRFQHSFPLCCIPRLIKEPSAVQLWHPLVMNGSFFLNKTLESPSGDWMKHIWTLFGVKQGIWDFGKSRAGPPTWGRVGGRAGVVGSCWVTGHVCTSGTAVIVGRFQHKSYVLGSFWCHQKWTCQPKMTDFVVCGWHAGDMLQTFPAKLYIWAEFTNGSLKFKHFT